MHSISPGTIIILNGASSSGKTSILKCIQDTFSEPFLDAGIDKFIWMLPKRFLDRPLWDDVLGLAIKSGENGRKLFNGMHHAIAALSLQGNNVVADHVLVEKAWWVECASLFHSLPAYLVKVYCPLEILVERERQRSNRTPGQAKAQYDRVHLYQACDLEIDSSQSSPQEGAEMIHTFIKSGIAPQAFGLLHDQFSKANEQNI